MCVCAPWCRIVKSFPKNFLPTRNLLDIGWRFGCGDSIASLYMCVMQNTPLLLFFFSSSLWLVIHLAMAAAGFSTTANQIPNLPKVYTHQHTNGGMMRMRCGVMRQMYSLSAKAHHKHNFPMFWYFGYNSGGKKIDMKSAVLEAYVSSTLIIHVASLLDCVYLNELSASVVSTTALMQSLSFIFAGARITKKKTTTCFTFATHTHTKTETKRTFYSKKKDKMGCKWIYRVNFPIGLLCSG